MGRIAVIGAAGLLGQYLAQEALRRGHDVLGTYNRTPINGTDFEIEHLDITQPIEVKRALSAFKPESVILPSAITNVDYCEIHPEEAQQVNVEGTRNVASTCSVLGSRLVYVSTDYVFAGEKKGRYLETDPTGPLSTYAHTKLEGEKITLDGENNSVCRVSVLYGWNQASSKTNFVTWVIDALRKGKKVTLFGDQFVSPTYAPHCAKALIRMVEKGSPGLYHTSGPDCIDRYTMGLMIADAFDLDRSLCAKITTEDMPLPARRCKNSCLDVSKAERELDLRMLPFTDGLKDMGINAKTQ